jgi:phage tail sheath protein FI
MPITPTYPGVYIEEIPSGVHTLTGVSTSITAFLGYTPSGPVGTPVEVFSLADYQRAFGGLDQDSPVSYAVQQFFQNGGTDAFVVRVASNAAAATAVVKDATFATAVLTIAANTAGTWGNGLEIAIDYDTANPASTFNLTAIEMLDRDGSRVPGRVETFRNLTLNSASPSFVDNATASSNLISVTTSPALVWSGPAGFSQSAALTAPDVTNLDPATANRVAVSVDGKPPVEVVVFSATDPITVTGLPAILSDIATRIAAKVNALLGNVIQGSAASSKITLTSNASGPNSSVQLFPASQNDATRFLKLGLAYGGKEVDRAAQFRPAQNGSVTTPFTTMPALATVLGAVNVTVNTGTTAVIASRQLTLWPSGSPPADLAGVAAALQSALSGQAEPLFAGTTARVIGDAIVVDAGPALPDARFTFSNVGTDTTATALQLPTAAAGVNVGRYALGTGIAGTAALAGVSLGSNGTVPTSSDLIGNPVAKTGIYALENVDLFNLLSIPDFDVPTDITVLTAAAAYCEKRRAFFVVDAPRSVGSPAQAIAWMKDPAKGGALRSRNVAVYWPRILAADPLQNGRRHAFAAAGALTGMYARTDAQRGVWKAPAGASATLAGALGLATPLTNEEQGGLNPIGLNALRTFPDTGTVAWGALTMRGADTLADEYKYIPVRRLALFLEESLFRGTQWVVFEPNDEPLWSQIRLNVGAFMSDLFRQGAFAGRTAREAYFVRCDSSTTTPNDVDHGRVNIAVGFAPLKPAEFVVIQIQQIASALVV